MIERTAPGLGLPIGMAIGLAAGTAPRAYAAEKAGRPHLCPEDAPEGVRLPPQPQCGSREAPPPRRATGFREILPGTEIRIGGRASSTFGAGR